MSGKSAKKGAPIRIGMVGCGRAGWGMHCSELEGRKDKFVIVAACDTLGERRAKMAERYGCATYAAIEDLLNDPKVELVDIATRSCNHFEHAALALDAGKTVFLEKPMCLTRDEAAKLADKGGNRLYIRHNRRFEPTFCHIREIIASGILGHVYQIKLRRGGFQRRDDWQTIKAFGGGQLLNWGPHIIDHALRFLKTAPVSIYSDLKNVAAFGDAEDHLHILLKNAAGLLVDLEISGGRMVPESEYIVAGTRGAIEASGSKIKLKYLNPDVPLARRRAKKTTPSLDAGFGAKETLQWVEKELDATPSEGGTMDSIWDHLFATIRQRKRFPIKLEEAVAVMDVISQAKAGTRFDGT